MLELIPLLSPLLVQPTHLRPIAETVEAALKEPQRCCASTPPQHGKTTVLAHGLVWLMQHAPNLRHGYVTYEAERAERVSLQVQRLAQQAGLAVDGTRHVWRVNGGGGGLVATGIGGPLTGEPIDGLLVIDDPYRNRQDAESGARRRMISDWFGDVAMSRLHPGASCLVVHTRWTPRDLIGDLAGRGWRTVNLPAIADAADDPNGRALGEPLWPAMRPLSFLEEQRETVGEYSWASGWQGHPRPRGGAVFSREPQYFERLPEATAGNPLVPAIGVDLAYTRRTYADHSVGVVVQSHGGQVYVTNLVSLQVEADAFGAHLAELRRAHPAARMRFYRSGTEKGSVSLLNSLHPGLGLTGVPATEDKFLRAQPVAAAWNAGRIWLPQSAPWLERFLAVLLNFTGVDDPEDDEVDALAAAYDVVAKPPRSVQSYRA